MLKLRRFIGTWRKLRASGRWMFIKAAISLVLIRIGLATLPFLTFRKIFHWFTKTSSTQEISPMQIDEVVWAVDTAANLLPFQLLCLPRALAAKYLLRKVPALTLEIGVEINPAKAFEAHAWVERNGSIIIGDWPDAVHYQRLWVWE